MQKNRQDTAKDYAFSGVFIPANIWLSNKLKGNKLLLLMLVHALDNGGCTASNQYLANTLDMEVRQVQANLSYLIGLGLVERTVSGPFRWLTINRQKFADFDRKSTMQKNACKPCRKMHPKHAEKCTQYTVENKHKDSSPTENVEGRESGDSAFYSSGGARARASSEGAFKAFDGDKGTGGANSAGKVSENPENAPWAGKSYSGRERYDLPTVEHHSEIHGLFQAGEFDVIEIAMGATGDFSRGGYGHWVKWLNQHISESMRLGMPKALENVTAIFIEELCFAFADCDGGTRSMAALFSARLNKAFKVAR